MSSELSFNTRDEFERKNVASNIIKLINSNIEVSPLILDGDWGTGKTEFSKKLQTFINQETTHQVVYIDAFKEDHADAPIVSITAGIASVLPKEKARKFREKALPAIKFCLKTGLKAGSAWVLKQDGDVISDEFDKAITAVTDKAIDSTIESLLDEHINLEKNLRSLRLALDEITKERKIVLIIDELDRCRPNYSVSFLESIKHIFDTENVIFILVANMTQLKASISHAYGASVDAKRYLDKFSKYTVNLPKYKPGLSTDHNSVSVIHWKNLLEKSDILKDTYFLSSEVMYEVIQRSNISLREVETLIRHFEIFVTISNVKFTNVIAPLTIYTMICGIFIHCFCSGDVVNNLSDESAILTVAKTLGIKKLAEDRIMDFHDIPYIDIVLFMFIKDIVSKDFKLYEDGSITIAQFKEYIRVCGLEQRHVNVPQTLYNTISTMSLSS